MQITMKYGRKGLPIELPDGLKVDVIRKKAMPILKDPEAALRFGLSHPVGCRPLAKEVKGIKDICIAICDITRPVPHGIVLPVLIQELIGAGVSPTSITFTANISRRKKRH
jgi:nickel-dependent lactate racemase